MSPSERESEERQKTPWLTYGGIALGALGIAFYAGSLYRQVQDQQGMNAPEQALALKVQEIATTQRLYGMRLDVLEREGSPALRAAEARIDELRRRIDGGGK